MIDYEKLQLAHELGLKTKNYCIEILFGVKGSPTLFLRNCDDNGDNSKIVHYKSLDDIIEKLKELTQPKPKYEVGQIVWFLNDKEIDSFKIDEIKEDNGFWCTHTRKLDDFFLKFDFFQYHESQLYPSREALIDAQIEYWNSLKYPTISESTENAQKRIDDMKEQVKLYEKCSIEFINKHISDTGIKLEIKECKHESDTYTYIINHQPRQHAKKCKHCGEFYH